MTCDSEAGLVCSTCSQCARGFASAAPCTARADTICVAVPSPPDVLPAAGDGAPFSGCVLVSVAAQGAGAASPGRQSAPASRWLEEEEPQEEDKVRIKGFNGILGFRRSRGRTAGAQAAARCEGIRRAWIAQRWPAKSLGLSVGFFWGALSA